MIASRHWPVMKFVDVYKRQTGTREGDFGSGTEFIYHIRISGSLTFSENLNQEILIIVIEMVHTISVIPVNAEIFRSRL